LELEVIDLPISRARNLYGADLVLIRPDQVVAWRGNAAPEGLFAKLLQVPSR
jgi:hypothetical protein